MRLVATKVDQSQAETAFAIYSEYAALESDPATRSARRTSAAKILFDASAFDRALSEFEKIVAAEPNNYDAHLYLGLAMFDTGDKAKFQAAADQLAIFADKAPADHPLRGDARSVVDYLKEQENITPRRAAVQKQKP
jgi:tetratricopeptide (TPR) repeat protein